MTIADLIRDVEQIPARVDAHIKQLVAHHEPAVTEATDALARVGKLADSPIVQALESAVGISPELEQRIADLISTFASHAAAVAQPEPTPEPTPDPVGETPAEPSGPDAEPDTLPAEPAAATA